MTFSIKDRLTLSLFINDAEFPFDRVNSLNYLHMSSSTRIALPMIRINLIDAAGFFTKNVKLVDGAQIRVIIKTNAGGTATYRFRYNTHHSQSGPSGLTYDIDGYLDAPLYWLKSSTDPIKGTSREVLYEIANRCGLSFSGDMTNDSQVWLPMNKKNWKFVKDVVDHGYKDDHSCMQSVVTLKQQLRYYDISDFPNSSLNRFVSGGKTIDNTYRVSDFKPKSKSGTMNTLSGYASQMNTPSVTSAEVTSVDKVKIRKTTTTLAVNSKLYSNVTEGSVQHRPIDCGNVNSNYEQGLYQNRRLSNLYSVGLDFITPDFTGVDPLDYISFEANTTDAKPQDKTYSGLYLVCSKAIYIQGINYYERFEVCRAGLDAAVPGQK